LEYCLQLLVYVLEVAKLASPIPPNIKMVGYPWRDFMSNPFIGIEIVNGTSINKY